MTTDTAVHSPGQHPVMQSAIMSSKAFRITIAAALLLFFSTISPASGPDEQQKIRLLLQKIRHSSLVFIRNGKEYPAAEAADHLRKKLAAGGSRIKTARDFIAGCATRSSITGEFYYIKFPDGTKVRTADWMLQRLLEIENK